ncbi:MAG: extracellular solute-binding protein, partial [Clostridia bacterium]|nr:extracellular solute-binding protein [Clostridia bacterium]
MKKGLCVFLALMMMLFACSLSAAEDEIAYDGSEVDVTIALYERISNEQQAALEYAVSEFNKLYPNIHVSWEHYSSLDYKYMHDLEEMFLYGGSAEYPGSIAWFQPDKTALEEISVELMALDSFIDSAGQVARADGTSEAIGLTDEQKAYFFEGFYQEGLQFGDGQMRILPFSKYTDVMYYNKTVFDANGFTVPATWDEMESLLGQIAEYGSSRVAELGYYYFPLGYRSMGNLFLTMTEQLVTPYISASEPHFLFNTEENRAFVRRFHDWYQQGNITTTRLYGSIPAYAFVQPEYGALMITAVDNTYCASRYIPAKQEDGSFSFEAGVAPIPQVDPANGKVYFQGVSLGIFHKSNEQEEIASWLLVKFLATNPDIQAEYALASGNLPVIKSAVETEKYADFLAKADGGDGLPALSAKVGLAQQDSFFSAPIFPGSCEAYNAVDKMFADALIMP